MNRHDLKRPVGWILLVLSVFVIFGTVRTKYGGGPLLHQLVPFFGWPFVVLFLAVQAGLCFWFRSRFGLVWITGALVVGLIGGSVGEAMWKDRTNPTPHPVMEQIREEHGLQTMEYDWTRHKLITGVCLSGIALGFGFVREKL